MTTPGRLYGVGVGPGDPDLVTVKAARLIAAADVVAYPVARRATSGGVARTTAGPYLRGGVVEVAMTYPITIEQSDHPGGYEAAIADFYDASAAEIATHLDAGRDVVVLCEGDPFFYGSYMYIHDRLADRYLTEVVPGVTSFSAAAAAAGTPEEFVASDVNEARRLLEEVSGSRTADDVLHAIFSRFCIGK